MSKQLTEGDFETKIQRKAAEVQSLAIAVKKLVDEKDEMAADAEERFSLSIKKRELESHKKKHKKM